MFPEAIFITINAMKPNEIPSAIENVKGIIITIIKDGINSLKSAQSNFWRPDKIRNDTYIKAPDVAYEGTILAKGDIKIENKNKKPIVIAVSPVLPPASIPDELST